MTSWRYFISIVCFLPKFHPIQCSRAIQARLVIVEIIKMNEVGNMNETEAGRKRKLQE